MLMNPRSLSLLVSAVLLLSACASQSAAPAEQASSSAAPSTSATSLCEALPADPGWHGDNHARLSAMIKKLGECGGSGDVTKGAPLALFDWDNTVVKNDIGDATTFWMLANGRVLQPTDWAKVSTFMTPAAAQALRTPCCFTAWVIFTNCFTTTPSRPRGCWALRSRSAASLPGSP